MDPRLLLDNLLSPPILFFLLGAFAAAVRSDLEVPAPAARFLSLYLLFSIGLHGGHQLSAGGLHGPVLATLGVAVLTSLTIPVWCFFLLRRRLPPADAAALAATYGSVSAVTFIAAVGFLDHLGVPFGGHMVAAMALMESPAIVVGILLARRFDREEGAERLDWRKTGHEAFLNGSVLLLVGSLVIGLLVGERGWKSLQPVVDAPFKGVLCLFLLDMGLVAARRLQDMRRHGAVLVAFALTAPALHAGLGIVLAYALQLSPGDALLLAALTGGASYIAVPAAARLALPKANPGLYVPMALGITFPFNVLVGIPGYHLIIQALWNSP
jgi:hypothetical protein